MNNEPAYTPMKQYDCDSSQTHYQGCKCHEARRNAEVDRLKRQLSLAVGSLEYSLNSLATLKEIARIEQEAS